MKKLILILLASLSVSAFAQQKNSNFGIGVEGMLSKYPAAGSVELQLLHNRWQYDIGLDNYVAWLSSIHGYHLGLNYIYRNRKSKYYVGAEYSNWRWKNSPNTRPDNYNASRDYWDDAPREKNHVFSLMTGANWRISRFFYFDLAAGLGYKLAFVHPTQYDKDHYRATNYTKGMFLPVLNVGFKYMISTDELDHKPTFGEHGIAAGIYTNIFLAKSVDVQWRLDRVNLDGGIDFFGRNNSKATGFHAGSSVDILKRKNRLFVAAKYTHWKTADDPYYTPGDSNLVFGQYPSYTTKEHSKHFISLSAGMDWKLLENLFLDTRLGLGMLLSKNTTISEKNIEEINAVYASSDVTKKLLPNAEIGLKYYLPFH